jgi:hypothetical protein
MLMEEVDIGYSDLASLAKAAMSYHLLVKCMPWGEAGGRRMQCLHIMKSSC